MCTHLALSLRITLCSTLLGTLCACGHTPPPVSQFPSAEAALERMHASFACARGVRGDAKIDHFSDKGRIRGGLMLFAVSPELVRFDVISPLGVTLSTLTSDGERFSLSDMREKKFYEGPASACNLARLTQVPVPGHALVALLRGEAPVLVHEPAQATLRWDSGGFYVIEVPSAHQASEEIHLVPTPSDFGKPWATQHVRVLDVRVRQQSFDLYHAELKDHAPATTAPPLVDENGIDPPIAPSGPACTVEVPRRIHMEVSASDDDVLIRYDEVKLNPPLPPGVFKQPEPGGVQHVAVGNCEL